MTTELERASAPHKALAEAVANDRVHMTDLLKAVGIDPNNPSHQAALMACAKYDLDPLMKHVIVIKGNVYVTADGYRYRAEQSGEHNGTTIVEQGETPTHWTATVSVWRKGVDHPFTFPGRYPKANKNAYGPEMAIVRAERNALARAFPISGMRPEPDDGRPSADTTAVVKEIDELDAVNAWKEEHGDPADDLLELLPEPDDAA